MNGNRIRDIPKELKDLIDRHIAYEKTQEVEKEELEYLYDYDYSEYLEHDYEKSEPEIKIIKIYL